MKHLINNRKHKAIIQAARSLFWKHGFRRVTVEEICREAAVSKMTFYRHFDNKIELAKNLYEQEIMHGIAAFKSIMSSESTSPHEKMEEMLVLKMTGTDNMSREFLKDFYASPELGLSAFVERMSQHAWNEILADFRTAQDRGWLRKDFKPEVFFAITSRMAELMQDEHILRMYEKPQDLVMELSRLFAYGIVARQVEG